MYKHIQKINIREDTKDTLLGIVSKQEEEIELKPITFKAQSEMEDIFKLLEEQLRKWMSCQIKNTFVKYIDEEVSR